MNDDNGLLAGIKVIDCGTYVAGPAAATIMSDFGADVLKIERPPHGDPYRYYPLTPGTPQSELNYCWILDGRNKKSLALNLGDDAGRDVLLKLSASADVFITNYQPDLIKKFRIDYDQLGALNPRLIYAYISGYGETGPDAGLPGFDATAYWARSGLMRMVSSDGNPSLPRPGMGDHPTSMALFGAIMLGLYRRQLTGRGMKVATSLLANGAWAAGVDLQAALCDAKYPERRARTETPNPLTAVYQSRDGEWFLFVTLNPLKEWPILCRALQRPELADDPRFRDEKGRTANASALVDILDKEFGARNMAQLKEIFAAHELTFAPIPAIAQVAADPQMDAAGVFAAIEVAGRAPLKTVASPITVEGVAKARPRLGASVGENSIEVLRALGYSESAINSLLDRGVVAVSRHDPSRNPQR